MTTNQQLEMIARLTGCFPLTETGDMIAVLERVCERKDCDLTIEHSRFYSGINWFVSLSSTQWKGICGSGETFIAASLAALEQLDKELNDDR